jgi:hypothetical protein
VIRYTQVVSWNRGDEEWSTDLAVLWRDNPKLKWLLQSTKNDIVEEMAEDDEKIGAEGHRQRILIINRLIAQLNVYEFNLNQRKETYDVQTTGVEG